MQNKNIKVGIVRGYYYGEHYTKLIKKLEKQKMIVEARDTEHLYKMLDDGWIQVTFNLSTSYLFYIDYYKMQGINIYDWAPEEEPLVRNLAFSKKCFSPAEIEKFRQTIDEMIEDGTIYNIFKKYIPEDNAKRMYVNNSGAKSEEQVLYKKKWAGTETVRHGFLNRYFNIYTQYNLWRCHKP